ncbi:NAD(P)H-dependent flavin oxidoreductase [Flammeovirga kamogawensis]|uniref:Nitronate monooxygenase n=1 Tax=Flammeovirga kamogawensis TaxID=373891 RepID=A0ABX8GWE1_9BACT|nr:nitronate monooxygenase [Flammeovirga kamogawensis]MBB6461147.1 enoyl-[acyl-carrier protein] reductase II [Flammeovirga kamogawensis]QWG07713.1 nitronate monooxygenase [Flammeovirga kamogawensis]TRX69520.1 nitronate monooxygenase [Flammeovirga kamogawensis]
MKNNRVCDIFGIEYPIISGGMVWCSGWKLAAAVSNAGGLGLIGAGSMHPDTFLEHVQKCKQATQKPFGVNIPLFYPEVEKLIEIIINEEVPIVFTSAGSPKKFTSLFKEHGIKVAQVVSSLKFALKSQEAGVDVVVAEGFEAGGHNGKEETTTMCLIPPIAEALSIPVISAGGIGSGKAMLAAFALGAEGVQIGSRFAISEESSAHDNFKHKIVATQEGDTILTLKDLVAVRLVKNKFYQQVEEAEARGATKEELIELLGKRRSKKGIFEGDLDEGEIEIGQVSAHIQDIQPAGNILSSIWKEFEVEKKRLQNL